MLYVYIYICVVMYTCIYRWVSGSADCELDVRGMILLWECAIEQYLSTLGCVWVTSVSMCGLSACVGGFMSADGELEERGMIDQRPVSAPPPKLSFTTFPAASGAYW